MTYTSIMKTIPTFSSLALLTDNVGFAKKKKKKTGDFLSQGVKNIAGAALIKETASLTD